jgi:hypothetical protein
VTSLDLTFSSGHALDRAVPADPRRVGDRTPVRRKAGVPGRTGQVTPVTQLLEMLAGKVEHFAQIDLDHPVGVDSDLQTLSLLDREDLIAPSSPSYAC